ncbi:unnamed protein product [Trichobilharzia szidati]|nr:unnamed protein product [Trichobilharzia szidati]
MEQQPGMWRPCQTFYHTHHPSTKPKHTTSHRSQPHNTHSTKTKLRQQQQQYKFKKTTHQLSYHQTPIIIYQSKYTPQIITTHSQQTQYYRHLDYSRQRTTQLIIPTSIHFTVNQHFPTTNIHFKITTKQITIIYLSNNTIPQNHSSTQRFNKKNTTTTPSIHTTN